jgi:hypothetical protein
LRWTFKNINSSCENVVENNLNFREFFFGKIVEIEFKNILNINCISAHKASLFISFTLLIGMGQIKAPL